jgi:hypothetical protein
MWIITGSLPAAWCALDDLHLLAGLQPFDLPNSGYLDWRELSVALVGASFPAVRTATAAQVAATAAGGGLGEVGLAEGPEHSASVVLSKQQMMELRWWFDPKPLEQGVGDDTRSSVSQEEGANSR